MLQPKQLSFILQNADLSALHIIPHHFIYSLFIIFLLLHSQVTAKETFKLSLKKAFKDNKTFKSGGSKEICFKRFAVLNLLLINEYRKKCL